MFSPVELEIELFCRGIQFDRSCELGADARRIARTRAGLGSGLELVIRGPRRDHWVNVPVAEQFAAKSPFRLFKPSDGYWILDERTGEGYRAALPEELIESELFGHVKGAFTGATAARKGKFELADGATIFLDEVGDMSPKVQAKVLRVLEEQRFLGLDNAGIDRNAVHRAHLAALRDVEVADAFGAFRGIDHVDLHTLRDRGVRALRLAHVTVDAFVGDHQRHDYFASSATRARIRAATSGCTKWEMSPPNFAISRTIVAEMNVYCSDGVRNSVSTSGYRRRFIPAI